MLAGHERTFTVKFMGKVYPLWKLVEHLAHITDKDDNDVVFKYNYQQCLLYLELCKAKEEGRQPRIDILKARQIGFSTMIAVQSGIIALFTSNTKVGIIADTEEHASGLFEKVQYMYDHLDLANPNRKLIESDPKKYAYLSYKPSLKYNKGKKMLQTAKGNSTIEVMCVSDSAGRSKHYTILHCSEVAFWKITEKALLALFKTVSRTNPNSTIYLETTANGFNEYKLRWDRDFSGNGASFTAFFAPWFENPEYSMKIPLGFDLMADMDQWEIDKMEKYHLTMEQMYWFHLEYLDAGRNKDYVLQEDPFDPTDAFISTGTSVFDKDLVAQRKREIIEEETRTHYPTGLFTCQHIANRDQSKIEIPISSIKWHKERDGAIKIFENPKKGRPYVIIADPNMGGSDNVAMQVIDNYTGEQVARFKSNKLANDQCAWQLYCLGYSYNWALISSETNVGQIVMELLVRANYPKLYVTQSESYQNYNRTIKQQFGHKTTVANRQYMIDSFVKAFRENPRMIKDYDTICEMESFQLVEHFDKDGQVTRSKQEAAGGSHDDLVMSLAAFYVVRSQQTSIPEVVYEDSAEGRRESLRDINRRLMEERIASEKRIQNRSMGIRWD